MKIQRITADNFMRLNLFDVDLTADTVHLFAGGNEAGKSSVQECVRFALLGETARVRTKAQYKLMIRDGAKSGTVRVNIDGIDIARNIKDGKLLTEAMENQVAQMSKFMPYLLNAQRFASTKYDERRSFLFALTGTKNNPDNTAKRMLVKGVTQACIDRTKPNLRNGFKSAHGEAVKLAAAARSEWKGLTGETYGSQKALTWKPEMPEAFDPQVLLDEESSLAANSAQVDRWNVEKGRAIAKLDDARKALSGQDKRGTFDPNEMVAKKLAHTAAIISLDDGQAEIRQMNAQLANARERVPVPCCECGALLRVSFSSSNVSVEPYEPMSNEDEQKLQSAILNKAEDNSRIELHLNRLRAGISTLQRLEAGEMGGSPKMHEDDIKMLEAQLDQIETELSKLSEAVTSKNELVSGLRIAANKVRDAKQTEARAAAIHQAVQDWELCYSTLAPDGIPAEILADALKPVNDRLKSASLATGWPQASIDPTMEIIVDGRPYALLSESAKWRADASIADAVSFLSGIGILILDGLDVLDLSNRAAMMKWAQSIMGDYDSILLFATLKTLPNLPEGMVAHWIEAGELLEAG